ncbi:NAD(P)/FAD-dependent oxidoreductase [Halorubellus sp. JP-L1]|uniref:FAD-dependent oxidoreductase n=1 Tax=Halorubellus sp. JP-L1 TaxID=2715753 RepID=UPI00140D8C3D|nr:NAD(P)/FAD-dependent oxidoreductase [Halorubellus sp. JP-L1]NHN41983.1 NAD(P)/FAD-dependent oxidoreductase [Halorubellus sp. JP-L1]
MTHVAIVGAYGSAGAAVAGELADEPGVELTLIDDGEPGGGLCILRGCMPSKEVISAGAHRFQARHDHRLVGDPPDVDLDAVVETKDDHVLGFAEHRRAAIHDLAERDDVAFHHDTARFVDDRTLAFADRTVEFDYVVVATGSSPNVPEIPGIETVGYRTSDDVLDATDLPDSGIVIGFGYVGLELVPYIAEAGGTDLTVIEHDARPLDEADPAFGDDLLEIYEKEWDVDVRRHAYERRVESTEDGGVRLYVDDVDGNEVAVEGEELFVFAGRNPNVHGLGLERTRLDPDSGGEWVRDTMQAVDDDRVFVVGDANAKEPILHVAKEQGFQAAENLLAHARDDTDTIAAYENVHHHVVFSALGVYPYARLGHSKASAEAADLEYVHVTRGASDDGVFTTKDVPDGRASLVVDADDGTVLGYQGLHYHADAMAKTMQLAVEMELDVREIPDRAYHPTTPEILDGLVQDASDAVED